MKICILVVDNPSREIYGLTNIARKLREKGFIVMIASKIDAPKLISSFKPQICLLPRVFPDFLNVVVKNKLTTDFFLLPSETGLDFPEKIENNLKGLGPDRPKSLSEVKKVFVPGNFYKEVVKSKAIFDEANIDVTGSTNTDRWRRRKYLDSKELYIHNVKAELTMGILLSLKAFPFGYVENFCRQLNAHSTPPSVFNWRAPMLAFETYYCFLLLELTRKNPEVMFNVRPHPHQSTKQLRIMFENHENVKVCSHKQDLDEFINQNDIFISSFSTSTFDILSHGKIPFSLDKLIPKPIYDSIPEYKKPFIHPNCIRPNSLEELSTILDKIAKEPESYNETYKNLITPQFKYYVKNVFNVPSYKYATDRIADEMSRIGNMRGNKKVNWIAFCRLFGIHLCLSILRYVKNRQRAENLLLGIRLYL